jgi:hypothetical protein
MWDTAKVIPVIRTELTRRGKGEVPDPIRVITEYWDPQTGEKLAEVDPCGDGWCVAELGRLAKALGCTTAEAVDLAIEKAQLVADGE